MRSLLAAVACTFLSGCATAVFNTASNEPWTPATPLDMGAPADVMLLEGIKRIQSWARVYEEVGGLNTEYRTTRDMAKITRDLPLSTEEKEILRMCDAPTSLEEICEASKLNDYDVCRSVWALLILGALMKS